MLFTVSKSTCKGLALLLTISLISFLIFALSGHQLTEGATAKGKLLRGPLPILPISTNFSKLNKTMSRSAGSIPHIIYGTAWKKGKTKELVELAVKTGFRGIDTACQPKHYHEGGVGEALEALYKEGIVTRNDVFLQTKFTAIRGQDPNNIPYDPALPLREQILQSFQVSLTNLKTHYLDSLVMHSPMERLSDTLLAWKTFEEIHRSGGALRLGLSNTYDIDVLRRVYDSAEVKPTVLQNRFYRQSGYDVEVRAFCREHGITYQSFWTLTGNPDILAR